MLHYAKAAEMESTYNQLTLVWNRLHYTLRLHIPEPKFLEQVDEKTSIWHDMVQNQRQQQAYERPPDRLQVHRQQYDQYRQPLGQQAKVGFNTKPPPPKIPIGDKGRYTYLVDAEEDEGYGFYGDEEPEQPAE